MSMTLRDLEPRLERGTTRDVRLNGKRYRIINREDGETRVVRYDAPIKGWSVATPDQAIGAIMLGEDIVE